MARLSEVAAVAAWSRAESAGEPRGATRRVRSHRHLVKAMSHLRAIWLSVSVPVDPEEKN